MLHWDHDRASIVSRILQSNGLIKCIVKTRDEFELIEGWISHNARVFGFLNVIIADNMSMDARVLSIYESFGPDLNVFQFSGNHNDIHGSGRFSELYAAVNQSSLYVIFVDADERVVWIENSRWIADYSIVDKIYKSSAGRGLNGTWLCNAPNSQDFFTLAGGSATLQSNAKWGKPVIKSEILGKFPVIHNSQYEPWVTAKPRSNNLFILHLVQFPRRRIMANRYKLINRGLFSNDVTLDVILASDLTKVQDVSVKRLIREIHEMLALEHQTIGVNYETEPDYLHFLSDGAISSSDPETLAILNEFVG